MSSPLISASPLAALSIFIPSLHKVSKSHDFFNASWRMSLRFSPMMIWSRTAVSSAVQLSAVHVKLQCFAPSNTRLQNVINVSPSF